MAALNSLLCPEGGREYQNWDLEGNLSHSMSVWAMGSIYMVCFALWWCSFPFSKSVSERILDLF